MVFKFCCLQVCPWFFWSHDCPKSPLCTTEAKMSNDPIGLGHSTLDLLNQGRNPCSVGFTPPPPGAVPQPQRAGWAGWRCLGDVLCWTGRGLGCSKWRCSFPTASGGFRLSTEEHPAGMPWLCCVGPSWADKHTDKFLSTYTSSVSDMLAISF